MTPLIPMLLKVAVPAVLDALITEKAKTKVRAAAKRRKATDVELHNAEALDLPKAFRWRGTTWGSLLVTLAPVVGPALGFDLDREALGVGLDTIAYTLGGAGLLLGWAKQAARRWGLLKRMGL